MELPARGTVRGSGMWRCRNSRVWAPASATLRVERSMSARSPERVCMLRTNSSISASCSGVAWTTRSGPSSMIARSSSVIRVAISTMVWRAGSSPVISRSIQASMRGDATGRPFPLGGGRTGYCPSMLRVPLHRLDEDLPVPAYARVGDAGADLLARTEAVLACRGGRALVPTGVAVAIPPGYAGFVLPRSGLALRHGITCLNAPGLIDSGYRGELQVILVNTDPEEEYKVARGDRIAQLVVMQVEQVEF